jgi:hypothetical protein
MYRMVFLQNAVCRRGAFCRDRAGRDLQRTRFIPGKESKELRIMVVSHNREIQSSSTTDSNLAPTSESIAAYVPIEYCPGDQRSAKSTIRKKGSTNSTLDKRRRRQTNIAISCRMPVAGHVRQRSLLPAQEWDRAPHPLRVRRARDCGVGCQ